MNVRQQLLPIIRRKRRPLWVNHGEPVQVAAATAEGAGDAAPQSGAGGQPVVTTNEPGSTRKGKPNHAQGADTVAA